MKRRIALGLALTLVVASTAVEAQLGGLLRKKAEEIAGGKKKPAAPAPTPTPTPGTDEPAAPPPAAPSGGGASAAAPSAEKSAETKAVSPLEVAALPVRQSAVQVLRNRIQPGPNGDWEQLPYIPAAAVAAAYALDDAAQVTLVETVGGALKSLVMSASFVAEHDKFVKDEHHGVNHGLKGVVGIEQAMKKNDLKALEAIQVNQIVAMGVDQSPVDAPAFLKTQFDEELAGWKKQAADVKRRECAKSQKLVATAQPLRGWRPRTRSSGAATPC